MGHVQSAGSHKQTRRTDVSGLARGKGMMQLCLVE